jgi:dTDP-glucose 4,6-dehydratase
VVPAFISQALESQPITIFGDGGQTRSFCYVSDLIEGIYRLMLISSPMPVNIGNPHELTVLDFAKEIIRLTGSKSELVYKPLPQDDPKQRRPDITRAKNLLQWEPVVDLEQGLKATIDYFAAKLGKGYLSDS